jgi:S1-C subfamily serine protease
VIRRAIGVVVALVLCVAGSAHAQSSSAVQRTPEEQRTIQLYKDANRSVVFITTRNYVVDPFEFFEDIKPEAGTGSGTVVDAANGIVVTNFHVIESAVQSGGSVEIMLPSGLNSKAKLVGYDAEHDIAVLKISAPPRDLVALPFGDSSKLEVGQRVYAIGNPFGLYRSLTSGIISSLERTMKTGRGAKLKDLIQTDAAINPGNSGGPLLDSQGFLIGINTAILSASGTSSGVGFAVPINSIRRILPEILQTGRVSRPQMGWQLVDTDQGPMILRIAPGSAAASAGLSPIQRFIAGDAFIQGYREDIDGADLLYMINRKRVHSRDEVEDAIKESKRSERITLTLRRGGIQGPEREVRVLPRWE